MAGGENHSNDDESSSSASSLFSHSDDEKINTDTNQEVVEPAANPQKGEKSSEESLFSSSSDEVEDVATTNLNTSPPSTITLNIDRTGSRDNSNGLFDNGGGAIGTAASEMTSISISTSDTPQPVYPTFEPPIQKEDPESDESSDEGSLFSLNEREEEKRKAMKQRVGRTAHHNSFGSPVIPRKKSAVSSAQKAKSTIPTNRDRMSDGFTRRPSTALRLDHEVNNNAKLKSTVTFDLPVKPAKKYVGKAAKALKKAPDIDESGTNGKSISCFRDGKATSHRVIKTAPEKQPDTSEDGIYYSWQKEYKEKMWSREFLKVKKYLREHGNNCDIPDGHSLASWTKKQQNICQKWLRNSCDVRGGISDKEFQTFVHIFRLHKAKFDWGYHIDRRLRGAILDWCELLSPTQQKVLLTYGEKSKTNLTPSMERKVNSNVEILESNSDQECEFDGAALDNIRKHTPSKKRNGNESNDKKHKHKKSKANDQHLMYVENDSFRDERPKKISWNSVKTIIVDHVQLPSSIQSEALAIYKTRAHQTDKLAKSKRGCWFDLEYADSIGHHVDLASSSGNKKASSGIAPTKRGWSEVDKFWSEVNINVVSPHEPFDSASHTSKSDSYTKKAKMIKSTESTKPITTAVITKKSLVENNHQAEEKEPSREFPGWTVERVRQNKRYVYYYYSPELKHKLRSRPEVNRFITIMKETGHEADAIAEYKCRYGQSPSKKSTPRKKHLVDLESKSKNTHSATHEETEKLLSPGDVVFAAWWKNKKQKSPVFYSGVVTAVKPSQAGIAYDIQFDDGEKGNAIDENFVIPKYQYLHNNLKHIYSVGDEVYSAWWPSNKRLNMAPAWYPGKIRARRILPRGGIYGPTVLYDILFDDGDEQFNIEDEFVFLKHDYQLSTKQLSVAKSEWIGVKNVVDKASVDPWAKVVGWYVALINGKELTYPLLSDALRSYDSWTVERLGPKTKKNDLNLPSEWIFSQSTVPARKENLVLIAGSKDIRDPHCVKQPQHVLKSKANSLNRGKIGSSGCAENDYITSINKKKAELKRGDSVYALWSGDNEKWYPGRIWDVNVLPNSDRGYGPTKVFDVVYDDGDTESGVKEIFVMKKVDYEVCILKPDKDWIGVKNVTDQSSEDEYAKSVGWYEVQLLDGSNDTYVFASLNEALRFYDRSVIDRKGAGKVLESDLNFPAETGFETS